MAPDARISVDKECLLTAIDSVLFSCLFVLNQKIYDFPTKKLLISDIRDTVLDLSAELDIASIKKLLSILLAYHRQVESLKDAKLFRAVFNPLKKEWECKSQEMYAAFDVEVLLKSLNINPS